MNAGIPSDPHGLRIQGLRNEKEKTLADLILDYLASIGTDHIFGVLGGAIEPLYNALARASRMDPVPVHAIISRHESGAAFMADGYARETGRLGACCATTGPGTTNLLTGVSSAYADDIPILVITAQSAMPNFGRLGLQESSSDTIDTVAMLSHCTRYSTLISHPAQLEHKLFKAIHLATSKPHGPTHISIPVDVLNTCWDGKFIYNIDNLLRHPKLIDSANVSALSKIISKANNPVLFLGIGCRGSIDAIIQFAESMQIPFVTTPSGKSLINSYHPLYRGVFGFASHESARISLVDSDLIIAVGTKLAETSTCGWDAEALINEKMVHIEESKENFSNSPLAQLHVTGSISAIFSKLIDIFNERNKFINISSSKNCRHNSTEKNSGHALYGDYAPPQLTITNGDGYSSSSSPMKPQRLMHELVQFFPENTRYISDAGNSWSWTTHYLHLKSTGCYHIGMGLGAMTWGIGAAIGIAIGAPGKPVVCITGDGSYLMAGQELTVAVQLKIPVVFVVLNDSALGMAKHGQRLGRGESIGYELPNIDYAAIARAMGAQGYSIKSHEDFESIDVHDILNADKPTLLDVFIDPEEPPPMGSRMKVLDRRQNTRRSYDGRRKTDDKFNFQVIEIENT